MILSQPLTLIYTQYFLILMPNQKMIEKYSRNKIDDAIIQSIEELKRLWPLKSVCINQINKSPDETKSIEKFLDRIFESRTFKSIEICQTQAKWSSLYPDPKSDILNYGLKMENRLLI